MAPPEELSDDFVSELLKKDARQSHLKYSSIGVDAFLPQRRANPTLKPNTRFLKTILKETESHNASLRKAEAHRNLPGQQISEQERDLRRDGRARRRSTSRESSHRSTSSDGNRSRRRARHRRHANIDLDSSSRTRENFREQREPNKGSRDRVSRSRSPRRRHKSTQQNGHDSRYGESGKGSSRREHRDRDRNPARRSCSPQREHGENRRHRHRESRTSRRDHHHRRSDRHRRSNETSRPDKSRNAEKQRARSLDDDSDPLDNIIGQPKSVEAPIPRGRGAHKSRGDMDRHFQPSYDPTTDIRPDSDDDDDDWNQALEALRDRERWKQLGASRLKEAGFSERDIDKWERGGEEREEDLQWKGSGEMREWDRGKVLTADGIETKPEWAKS